MSRRSCLDLDSADGPAIEVGSSPDMYRRCSCTDKSAFYDLVDRDMDGNEVKMDKFKGDVLCVINVASK